jgi:hypothetical protein
LLLSTLEASPYTSIMERMRMLLMGRAARHGQVAQLGTNPVHVRQVARGPPARDELFVFFVGGQDRLGEAARRSGCP